MNIKQIIEKAEAGDMLSQSTLGTMYYQGDGVSIDYEKAFYWVKKSAAQEHINAMYNLGYMYWSGDGTSQDYEKAFYWFSKAAEQGFYAALNYLGVMYRDGDGVDEDFEEAYIYFAIAANALSLSPNGGLPDAQCNLALMYIEGNGVPESLSRAGHWVNLAYKQGSEFAAEMLDEYELWDYIDKYII
jgi:TPR repeat protein